jgi:hypothetical protein
LPARRGFLISDDKPLIRESSQESSSEQSSAIFLSERGALIDCILCDCSRAPIDCLQSLKTTRVGDVRGCSPGGRLGCQWYVLKSVSSDAFTTAIKWEFPRKWQINSPKSWGSR